MITNEQFKRKLLKISILADILEAETKAIRPEKELDDLVFAMKIRNAQQSCTSLRRYFDKLLNKINHLTGDYYDEIDQTIENKINELNHGKTS